MKKLPLILLVLCATTLQAKNYYISTQGNDSNSGLTPAAAWQSITKLNTSFNLIVAGDSVLFKCAEIFYGSILIVKSGTAALPIVISSYGTGAKPIITGFSDLSSWVSVGAGVYQSTASNIKNSVNLVTLNNIPQAIGRYPNSDAPNGGYLTYESFSTTSITDNELTAIPNWKGAEVIIRKQHYQMEKCKITDQTNNTIRYTTTPTINPLSNLNVKPLNGTKGFGYFIQNDPRTLDKLGEWYYNSSSKAMQMFFGSANPSTYSIKVSTVDTLINVGMSNYITVNNIGFEGADLAAVYALNGSNITVQNCDIKLMGAKGIFLFNTSNTLIDNVSINYALCGAIDITSRHKSGATVRNCIIKNTAIYPGMGSRWDDNDYNGISVTVLSDGLIEYNKIDTTGYIGTRFQGSNFIIRNNVINYSAFIKDDGGSIYTYAGGTDAAPTDAFTNRTIKNNICINNPGAPLGAGGEVDVDGIYLDGRSMNIDILNNTVANIGVHGIYCVNSNNVNIRNNTSFNDGSSIGLTRNSWGSITNLSVKQNIFYPKYPTQTNFDYVNSGVNIPVANTIQSAMQSIGKIDSNYYAVPNATGFNYYYSLTEGGGWIFPKPLTFEGWKSFTKNDNATKLPAVQIATYQINSLISSNKVTNGQFTTNIAGITVEASNNTSKWDNTGKVTGTGSLSITPAIAGTDYSLVRSSVGAISSSKKYILRFTSVGSSSNGVVRAYIRKTSSPWNNLIAAQLQTFTTSKTVHEFLFDLPATDADGSFVIEVQQTSGTTYLDDIEFYEADVSPISIDDQLRLEFNATTIVKVISLGAKYIDVDSNVYNGTVTLQPFTSIVLIKSGAVDQNQVKALTADAGQAISIILPNNNTVLKGSATGIIKSYEWSKVSGPDAVVIATPTGATTQISNLTVGKYTFKFKVIDTKGDSVSAFVTVTATGILPVSLISFIGKTSHNKISLQWSASSEINVSSYNIERSSDGKTFEYVGHIESSNLADIQTNYTFDDDSPLQGTNHYRLVMIDKDGTFKYSKTISLDIQNVNPFTLLNVDLSGRKTSLKMGISSNVQRVVNLSVVNVAGMILYSKPVQLQRGLNFIDNKIPSFNTGVYYVTITSNQKVITRVVLSSN